MTSLNNIKKTFFFFLILLFFSCSSSENKKIEGDPRFISFAPSITENFIYLKSADYLIGKTKFSNYPEVEDKENIGGITNYSQEKIFSLNPDYLVCLTHQESKLNNLKKQFRIITLKQKSIASIYSSIQKLDSILPESDTTNIQRDKQFYDSLRNKYKQKDSNDSALVLVSGSHLGQSNSIYFAAASGSYYSEVLSLFNIKNVYTDSLPEYRKISAENILRLKPSIIMDVSTGNPLIRNIKKNLNYNPEFIVCNRKYASIPGPISLKKFVITLDSLLSDAGN